MPISASLVNQTIDLNKEVAKAEPDRRSSLKKKLHRKLPIGSLGCLVVLLLLPQVFTMQPGWFGRHLGWARVLTGDEPHYLVLVNSVLNDHDLDLRNNYESAFEGSRQAGEAFAFANLDHHVTYYVNNNRRTWGEMFIPYMAYWPIGRNGHRTPLLRGDVDSAFANAPEYSGHPVGVAFLLAPFLFPFRQTALLEPMAILLAGLSTIFAMFLYRRLLFKFTDDTFSIYLCLFGVFLGTPIWYYSRTFFNEPFILLAVVGMYSFHVTGRSSFLAGCFLAAGMLMKPQLLLLAVPIVIVDALKRDWKRIIAFGPMPFVAGLVILYWNHRMYGSVLRGPYPFYLGQFNVGAVGLLFSRSRGLGLWAPVLFLGLLGWWPLLKGFRSDAVKIGSGFLMIFALTSIWKYWDGGWCFGPRLIVPVLPLLGLGLIMLPGIKIFRRLPVRMLLLAIVGASIAINYAAVRQYWLFLGDQPSFASVVSFWTS